MKTQLLISLILLTGHAQAQSLNLHSPEQEANEIRRAREEQAMHRFGLQLFGRVRSCEYLSNISTPAPRKRVALTFDDGPEPGATPKILAVLKKYDVHAEFFQISSKAKAHPELVRAVLDAGHSIVANHSWTHPNFHSLSVREQEHEIDRGDELFSAIYAPVKLFRFPYGNSTCESIDHAHALGYKLVGWHVDSCDWGFNGTGSVNHKDEELCEVAPANVSNYVQHVLDSIKKHHGGIILMHEIQPITVRNLDRIVGALAAEGYSFGTLDEADFQDCLR